MRRRHSMPFGAEITDTGTRFTIWAPGADEVSLILGEARRDLADEGDGWRRTELPGIGAGTRYAYVVDGAERVPDPASRFQPEDVAGPSMVIDPAAYEWQDGGWRGRPWEEAVLYEVHVGTATPQGTFAALTDRLAFLRETGVTAIELMPVSDFAGTRNWGYDGVLPYAPDSAYGTPDDLKRLVDRAHGLGLSVILDVVYNHFGPVGNHLPKYAASFFTDRHQTPWGAGLNLDGDDGRPVREFFIHNALYWVEEFHLDGLRFDAVHAILDDSDTHIVAELARRIRAAVTDRPVHLILENERNSARWLARSEGGEPILHDAQWNDDLHHCWHVVLTGEREAYYEDYADRPVERLGRCLAEGFAYQGEPSKHGGGVARGEPSGHLPPSAFVAFLQNHDQIGNRALGERLVDLAPPHKLALARAGLLLSPQVPMLFMGEEWGATTPFQFFVDFADDAELSKAVRDGRRREFQHFAAFADPAAAGLIPDPTDEATFRRSVLDWDEVGRTPHAAILAETRRLLALRREEIVPLARSRFLGAIHRTSGDSGTVLDVEWRFEAGTLRFRANVGEAAAEAADLGGRLVWASPGVEGGSHRLSLPSWSGAFTIGERDAD